VLYSFHILPVDLEAPLTLQYLEYPGYLVALPILDYQSILQALVILQDPEHPGYQLVQLNLYLEVPVALESQVEHKR
jgi:hypothetical protein